MTPAPAGLEAWAATQASLQDALRGSPRIDWSVWLAASDARNDEERREIIDGACLIAEKGGLTSWLFHLSPRGLERAHLWASPDLLSDIDVVVADWLHGVLLATLVVVPLAVFMTLHSPTPGAARSIFFSDLITIPLAIALTIVGYVLVRRLRFTRARRTRSLDFSQALGIVLDALHAKARWVPDSQSGDANTFRLRMESVYRHTRAG